MTDVNYMDIGEFVEAGYLQEVNRGFFHPHGLALEAERDEETGEWRLSGVWDYRDDPEGVLFADTSGEQFRSKAQHVYDELVRHSEVREGMFGQVIQPLGHTSNGGPS